MSRGAIQIMGNVAEVRPPEAGCREPMVAGFDTACSSFAGALIGTRATAAQGS
jgi:hypothetical protein